MGVSELVGSPTTHAETLLTVVVKIPITPPPALITDNRPLFRMLNPGDSVTTVHSRILDLRETFDDQGIILTLRNDRGMEIATLDGRVLAVYVHFTWDKSFEELANEAALVAAISPNAIWQDYGDQRGAWTYQDSVVGIELAKEEAVVSKGSVKLLRDAAAALEVDDET